MNRPGRMLNSFYDSGVADDSLFTNQPVNFHVGLVYTAQAKLLMAAILLVFLIVAALLYFIIRQVRRRRTENETK